MTDLRLHIHSETAPLEHVIVHTPGSEMDLVAPDQLHRLLFEDILFLADARAEHEVMCRVLSKVVGSAGSVVQVSQLLEETFLDEDARREFISDLCRISADQNLSAFEQDLCQLDPAELLQFALTGVSPLNLKAFPLPNLMFMRDVAAVVGDHAIISHPATAARAREGVIMRAILTHHPAFSAYRNRLIRLDEGMTFEGGDLLVVSDRVVLIGCSQRTSFGGIITVAKTLLADTKYEQVIMINLPKERFCMHLDTVFTFMSRDECMAYPPLIGLSGLNHIVGFTRGKSNDELQTQIFPDLKTALEEAMGRTLTFAPCGGSDPLSQQREQWTDGANLFCLAPGVVLGYDRNSRSFDELAKLGYRLVSAEGFLTYHESSDFEPGEKIAIRLDGSELSRGRGGPRCMTLPVSRKLI